MPIGRVCGAARGAIAFTAVGRAGRSDLVAGADLGEGVVLDADAHPGCGSEGRGQDDVQGRPRIPLERLVVCDNTHELGAIHSVIGERFSTMRPPAADAA